MGKMLGGCDFRLVGAEVAVGFQESRPSASWFLGCGARGAQPGLAAPGLGGEGLAPAEGLPAPQPTPHPSRRTQGTFRAAALCFLLTPPLFLHALSTLQSSCLNLPFGGREDRGAGRKPISYREETRTRKGLVLGRAPQAPTHFR